jgi:opacity protein-like surface antigen
MKIKLYHSLLYFLILLTFSTFAQDKRVQFPSALANSYFEVNFGYIYYPFTAASLEPGYTVEKISIPRNSLRIVLYGHNFNKYLAAQVTYTRPLHWAEYTAIGGTNNYADTTGHSVIMNMAGLTFKGTLPIGTKLSFYGEVGLAIVTRDGFREVEAIRYDKLEVVTNESYASTLFGAGINYNFSDNWALKLSGVYSPPNPKIGQPFTAQYAVGFAYTMRQLSKDIIAKKEESKFIFPRNLIQVGFATNSFGYGINDFLSDGTVPVFWGGRAHVETGFSVQYQRNIFHGKKYFSFDWGTTLGFWRSEKDHQKFMTISVFPLFRFTLLRTKSFDFYLNYSLAGPTFISGLKIDDRNTGPHFTFQDNIGVGLFIGKERKLNTEVKIGHYSNGNLFTENDGVKIPLTVNLGYTF